VYSLPLDDGYHFVEKKVPMLFKCLVHSVFADAKSKREIPYKDLRRLEVLHGAIVLIYGAFFKAKAPKASYGKFWD
jgi:hypothetical protein